MKNNNQMVDERIVWEKLQNIQIFCGRGKFFFAFKKLDSSIDLDYAFIDLLKPGDTSTHLENDHDRPEYKKYFNSNQIFEYDKMPAEFYLRKLYYYCNLNETRFDKSKEELIQKKEELAKHPLMKHKKFRKMIQRFIKKRDKISNDIPEKISEIQFDENSFNYKEIVFLMKFFKIFHLYKTDEKAKSILNEYSKFVSEKSIKWKNYCDIEFLEELDFLELLYKTKTFDNGKGKLK
jgi:hypothetical protein